MVYSFVEFGHLVWQLRYLLANLRQLENVDGVSSHALDKLILHRAQFYAVPLN